LLIHFFFFVIGLFMLLYGELYRYRYRHARLDSADPQTSNRLRLIIDVALIGIFGLAPLLSCILVYPRNHYVIMLEFIGCLLIARLMRGSNPPSTRILATVLSIILLLSINPLPLVPQQSVEIITTLRSLPPIREMLEDDGGWCYYLRPPCSPHYLYATGSESPRSLMTKGIIDAVLVSPQLRLYEETNPDAALDRLLEEGTDPGWISYPLIRGYSIFYRHH
jgi:hypothetical protein